MSEDLGKMEKPPVESFTGSRKLFVVPLIFSGKDAPEGFIEIYHRCWKQIDEQLTSLETKLGNISRIYHEMVFFDGEEGMKILEQLNPGSHKIVKPIIDRGALLQAAEDADLALECMDWERCLMVAMGDKVRQQVAEFFTQSSLKRYDHFGKQIEETLVNDERGLVFARDGHRIQFPDSIEVFNVYPPAIDELNRWLRNYQQQAGKEQQGAS